MATPRMRVVAGPNGSGKSTIIEELLKHHPDWIGTWVNADEIEAILRRGPLHWTLFDIPPAPDLPGRLREFCLNSSLMEKTGRRDETVAAMTLDVHGVELPGPLVNSYVAGTLADFIRHQLLAAHATFTFETVMSAPDKADLMAQALEEGYRTYLYFVGTSSPDINIDRVAKRVERGGHNVSQDRIRERYTKSLANLEAACAAATRAYVFDNSGSAHELVAEITEDREIVFPTGEIPHWLAQTSLIQRVLSTPGGDADT